MTRHEDKPQQLTDGVEAMAHVLAIAWGKYVKFLDVEPRGTVKQLEALLELAGGEDMLIRVGRAAEVAKMARGIRAVAKKARKKK